MKETEQTLLDQIKDQVAIAAFKLHWNDIANPERKVDLIDFVCERYATAKAKASCGAESAYKEVESSEPQENQELKEAVAGQETLALDLCRCMDLLNRCYWNMITFVPSDKTMSHAEWMDCLNELELFRTEHPPTKFSNVKNPVSAPSESQEDLWKEVVDAFYYCNTNEKYLLAEQAIKKKFTITRKPE